jgi:hypothetical protein
VLKTTQVPTGKRPDCEDRDDGLGALGGLQTAGTNYCVDRSETEAKVEKVEEAEQCSF